MNSHGRRKGLLALAGALAVPLFLPGAALAAHDLRLYKVEKQVTIDSDGAVETVSCTSSNDYALDGMWRIDHVDYDEDVLFKDLIVSTDVLQAANASADPSRYDFAFTKNAIGRVQLKVFVTCLENRTASDASHTHGFNVSAQKVIGPASLAAGDHDFGDYQDAAGPRQFTVDQDTATPGMQPCLPNEVVVSPSFTVSPTSPATEVPDEYGRPIASTLARLPAANGYASRQTWRWKFRIAQPVDVAVSVRCLKIKVTAAVPAGPSKHKLIVKRNKDATQPFGANSVSEKSLICGAHYKAVVAGWELAAPDFTWFLGMDPRIKSRAYRAFNSDSSAQNVNLTALCFNYRTT